MAQDTPVMTLDEIFAKIGFGRFHVALFFLGSVFKATESIEMYVVSIVTPVLQCVWRLTSLEGAFLTAAVFFGLIVSGPIWGSISDLHGRRAILFFTSILVSVYGCLSSLSPNYPWLLFLRMTLAFFLNGVLIITMSYVLEFSPMAHRGKVIVFLCVSWPIGGLIMAGASYLSIAALGWRVMLVANAVPLLIPIIALWFFPRSPHYLLTIGKKDEAKRVIDFIIRCNKIEEFKYDLAVPGAAVRTQFRELFNRKSGPTIAILMVMYFGQGIVYIGHLLLIVLLPRYHHSCLFGTEYSSSKLLIDDSCCSALSGSTFLNIAIASVGEIGSVMFSASIIDRIGRRKTMALNGVLGAVTFLLLGVCTGRALTSVFFAVSRGFVSGFTVSLLLFNLEAFPTSVRNLALGFCEITSFTGSLVTSFVVQIVVSKGHGLTVVISYSCILLFLSICAWFLPRETAARPLKDVAAEIEQDSSILSKKDQYGTLR